jgi:hypothetical protein
MAGGLEAQTRRQKNEISCWTSDGLEIVRGW